MVKKVKKYLKFVVCCALILSLVAPSYAALSASDGSAFVTKAEFDSALADFNARLTTFEAGINSKIDSQVSSYLDRNGIWNGKDQVLTTNYRHSTGYLETAFPNSSGAAYAVRAAYFWNCWDKVKVIDNVTKSGLAFITFTNGVSGCPAGIGAISSVATSGAFQLAEGWSQDEPPFDQSTYSKSSGYDAYVTQSQRWADKWSSTLLIAGETNPLTTNLIRWDSGDFNWHHGAQPTGNKHQQVKDWVMSPQVSDENTTMQGGVYDLCETAKITAHLVWPTGAHTTSMFLEKGKPLWFSTWFRAVNSWSGSPSSAWPPGSSHYIVFKQKNSKSLYNEQPSKYGSGSSANECFWFSEIKVY